MAGELTSFWLARGRGVVGAGAPILANLTVSPNTATVGVAYSGTVSGKTAGSTLALSGAGAAGLSVSGNTISGTPTTAGTINVTETLAGAIGSPKLNSGVVTVASATSAPAAFTAGQWSVADAAMGGTATVTISALPNNGGSAITAIQYQVGAGSWTNSGISSTGSFNITGLTNGAAVNVKVRAVNAVGNGPDSDAKSVTPTAGYDSDAQAYFNVMSPALVTARKDLVNPIFVEGKNSGWFGALDDFRLQAQTGSGNYKVNLKTPTGPLLSEFNSPVFTDDRGVQGDAIAAYLGTGYNFTAANQFLQDAATVFCYINATPSDGNNTQAAIGMDTTAGTLTFLRTKDSTGGRGGRINATTNDNSGVVPSRLGFAAMVRKTATTVQFYGADGLPIGGALTRASAAMQMKEMLLLRLGTIYCADRIAASGAGGALTDAQVLSLRNTLQTYLTAIGANV